jgi:hypothetical protein
MNAPTWRRRSLQVELLVDGEVVETATGANDGILN